MKHRKYLIGCGVVVLALFGCCGGLGVVGLLMQRGTQKELAEGDRLWESGQKAEAVAKYEAVLDGSVSSVDPSRRPTVFQRVVEFEVQQGNTSAAKRYAQKAGTFDVSIASENPAVNKLLAEVRVEKEEAERKKRAEQDAEKHKDARKTAKGDELKAMSLTQITSLLGPPDETYRSRKPPNNMYLHVWKSEGGTFITVSFIRRIDNGEATIITADSDRPRSVVENLKKTLDQN